MSARQPRAASGPLLLPGTDPAGWLAAHLLPRVGATPAGAPGIDLPSAHARLVAGGATPQAAAKWLSAWYPGLVAHAVGWVLGTAGAALVVDPGEVRFAVVPEGWPSGADLGPLRVAVAPDHPWAGRPGADVVAPDAVLATALASVVAQAGLVEQLRALARVGRPSLWAEVADRLGTALSHDAALPVCEHAAGRLRAVVRLPGAPWRAVPRLEVEPTAAGPAYLPQKGGCCLAYQCAPEPEVLQPGSWLAVYRERFPAPQDAADRCSTCSLLDPDACRARQRLWVEHHRAAQAPA